MKNKTLYVPLAIFMVLSILLTACGTATQTSTTAPTQPQVTETATTAPTAVKTKTYVLVPKSQDNPYSDTVNKGAQEAAKELGVTVQYQGPATADATAQIQLLNSLIPLKVDGLAISADDSFALVPVGQTAMMADIPVVSWDSPINSAGRNVQINTANPEDIGRTEVQLMAKLINSTGKVAILSAASTAANQNEWIKWMKDEFTKPEYANMQLVDVVYGDDDDAKSYTQVQGLLKTYPDLKGIIAPTTVGIAAAARAVQDGNMIGKVIVTGLGTPNRMRGYVKNGTCPSFEYWNPSDLGYLAIFTLDAIASGRIKGAAGDKIVTGKLGDYTIAADDTVVLGLPTVFDNANIDNFDF